MTSDVDIIKRLLREYAAIKPSLGDIEVELEGYPPGAHRAGLPLPPTSAR